MTVAGDTRQVDWADDLARSEIQAREARWWYLEPGEPGYDEPLHTYLGMSEDEWRDYAIGRR